ncbi:MAG: hypothetical protein AMXMBFR84_32060 [Candidatus Hydrogenedentota bacterium]
MKDFMRTAMYVVGGIFALLIVLMLLRFVVRLLILAVALAVPVLAVWAIWRYVVQGSRPTASEAKPVIEVKATIVDPLARRTIDKVDERMAEIDRRLRESGSDPVGGSNLK